MRKRHHPPPPPPTPVGVQASRIADMLERFGVNTFSSTAADSNRWGSWPADYSAASVIAALDWLTAESGMTIQCREYHYADRDWQTGWCSEVHVETGSRFTVAIGAGGSINDAVSLAALAVGSPDWLAWVEGVNEPNNDFGNGPEATSDVVAIQKSLADNIPANVKLAGPSVVFGLPYPEGYITPAYFSAAEMTIAAHATASNAHFYPPTAPDMPDGSSRGGAFSDVIGGMRVAYGFLPVMITEWHPTLYNTQGHSLDPAYDAYYAPMFFLAAFRENVTGWWWYALLDFGTTYLSGLFPKTGGVDPRPVANTIRAMFRLTGDKGSNKRTFAPGRLAFTVAGLPVPPADAPHMAGQTMLFQNSLGTYFLFVWDARETPEGNGAPVTITFAKPPSSVLSYKISGTEPERMIQHVAPAPSVTINLNGAVHLLVVTP